jgi:cysteine synthase
MTKKTRSYGSNSVYVTVNANSQKEVRQAAKKMVKTFPEAAITPYFYTNEINEDGTMNITIKLKVSL